MGKNAESLNELRIGIAAQVKGKKCFWNQMVGSYLREIHVRFGVKAANDAVKELGLLKEGWQLITEETPCLTRTK